MPEGGFVSLDYTMEGNNPFSEFVIDDWWIDKRINVERQVIFKELFKGFYEKCIYCEDECWENDHINKYLKCELDLLLKGYTNKQVNRMTERIFPHGYNVSDLEVDIKNFRRIFKQIFGI